MKNVDYWSFQKTMKTSNKAYKGGYCREGEHSLYRFIVFRMENPGKHVCSSLK
jgi:hypothetical protein